MNYGIVNLTYKQSTGAGSRRARGKCLPDSRAWRQQAEETQAEMCSEISSQIPLEENQAPRHKAA